MKRNGHLQQRLEAAIGDVVLIGKESYRITGDHPVKVKGPVALEERGDRLVTVRTLCDVHCAIEFHRAGKGCVGVSTDKDIVPVRKLKVDHQKKPLPVVQQSANNHRRKRKREATAIRR